MSIPLPPTKININHNKLNQNQFFINNPLINNKTHHKNPKKKSQLNPQKPQTQFKFKKFKNKNRRNILKSQFPISRFNFLIGRVPGNAKDFIRVSPELFLTVGGVFLLRLRPSSRHRETTS